MTQKKNNFFSKLKEIKGIEFVIAGVIAVLVITVVLGDSFGGKDTETDEVGDYVTSLENRLEKTLSQIKGAGKVSVVITVAGGNKTVIATDVTTVKDGEQMQITETPVLVGGKVVVLNELYPEVVGVLIVSSGADDITVKMNLMSAATTLLTVDESRVHILTAK